jgi:hypothetical protein
MSAPVIRQFFVLVGDRFSSSLLVIPCQMILDKSQVSKTYQITRK